MSLQVSDDIRESKRQYNTHKFTRVTLILVQSLPIFSSQPELLSVHSSNSVTLHRYNRHDDNTSFRR